MPRSEGLEQPHHVCGIHRKLLTVILERAPDDRNDRPVALDEHRSPARRLGLEVPPVHEDDLVTDLSVNPEDVLHDSEIAQITDRRRELLTHLTSDSVAVGFAELDAATDQPVISVRVLHRRRVEADGVRGSIRIGRDEHGLDPDATSIDRHPVTLSQPKDIAALHQLRRFTSSAPRCVYTAFAIRRAANVVAIRSSVETLRRSAQGEPYACLVTTTTAAYSARAAEYTDLLGSMSAVHQSDRQIIESWAARVEGDVLDAGCGPGHWTNHLNELGLNTRGIDLVPSFINHARSTYPGIRFDVGSIEHIDTADGSLAGVLSWFSTIHHEPGTITAPLSEFARVLRPGGQLALGFFSGTAIEPFDHAVTRAYRWPTEILSDLLQTAGFDVSETYLREAPGHRPVGTVICVRRGVER